MRILIAGGFGFVGGRLGVHLAKQGHKIVLGTRKSVAPPLWLPTAEVAKIDWWDNLRTFNCGVGMVACVSPDDVAETKRILEEQGETVFELGRIEASDKDEAFVEYV